MSDAIRFMKFAVTKGEMSVKVTYHMSVRNDKTCVVIYERDYGYDLGKILPGVYTNDTDIMTDYFDHGKAVLFPEHPLFAAAKARCEQNNEQAIAKRNAPRKELATELIATAEEDTWEVTVRGIRYVIHYRFKPKYMSWLVRTFNPQAGRAKRLNGSAKWLRSPAEIEGYYRNLTGIAAKLDQIRAVMNTPAIPEVVAEVVVQDLPVVVETIPANCIAFPARRRASGMW